MEELYEVIGEDILRLVDSIKIDESLSNEAVLRFDGVLKQNCEDVKILVSDVTKLDHIEDEEELIRLVKLFQKNLAAMHNEHVIWKNIEDQRLAMIIKGRPKVSIKSHLSLKEIEDEGYLAHVCLSKVFKKFSEAFVLQAANISTKQVKVRMNQLRMWIKTLPIRLYSVCQSKERVFLSENVCLSCSRYESSLLKQILSNKGKLEKTERNYVAACFLFLFFCPFAFFFNKEIFSAQILRVTEACFEFLYLNDSMGIPIAFTYVTKQYNSQFEMKFGEDLKRKLDSNEMLVELPVGFDKAHKNDEWRKHIKYQFGAFVGTDFVRTENVSRLCFDLILFSKNAKKKKASFYF